MACYIGRHTVKMATFPGSPQKRCHVGEAWERGYSKTWIMVTWLHQTSFKTRMNFASLPLYCTMTYHLLDLSPTSANRQTSSLEVPHNVDSS